MCMCVRFSRYLFFASAILAEGNGCNLHDAASSADITALEACNRPLVFSDENVVKPPESCDL